MRYALRMPFIVLDGPDASGTSTHAGLLAERLKAEGHDVLLTSEPTGGPIGKKIREYLKTGAIEAMELQMLFTQDRAWHVDQVITPALKDGKTVVCDRYWYSTIIYAHAQDLNIEQLKELNNSFIQPDAVFFTLPPLSVSLERMRRRGNREIFEREELQERIYEGYLRMAQEHPNIQIIDTSRDRNAVADELWSLVTLSAPR